MDDLHLLDNKCGTKTGYNRHYRKGEKPCVYCRQAHNEQNRVNRARRNAGEALGKPLAPCGTYGAFRRHQKNHEVPCDACRLAARKYWRKTSERVLDSPVDSSKCGTYAGYTRHKRHGQQICDACMEAKRDYQNKRNREKGMSERLLAVCGTAGGYRKHLRTLESPCEPCREAKREDDRKRLGREPFTPAQCGTRSGYQRHWRAGEQACDPCIQAYRDSVKPRKYWTQLWEIQEGVCALCDRLMPYESESVHVDHIVPKSKGGGDSLSNLQAVHARCNLVKCDHDNDEARQRLLLEGTKAV